MKNNLSRNSAVVKSDSLKEPIQKYTDHKKVAMRVAQEYLKTDLPWKTEWAGLIQKCGREMVWAENPETKKWEVALAMFCQKRLCPVCCWRRSVKTYSNIYDIITDQDFKKTNAEFIMLGLTVRNVPGNELPETLDRLLAAWQVLTDNKRQPFRKAFLGTFRSLEITYNRQAKTFHPHFHVLAAVPPEYFSKENAEYMSHEKLIEVWKDALNRAVRIARVADVRELDAQTFGARLDLGPSLQTLEKKNRGRYPPIDYDPDVDIEKVRKGTSSGIAEVAKYTVKPSDYATRREVLEVLDPALRRRRLIAYGGLFQQIYKKLNLEDEEAKETMQSKKAIEIMKNPLIKKMVATWDFSLGTYKITPYKEKEGGQEAEKETHQARAGEHSA